MIASDQVSCGLIMCFLPECQAEHGNPPIPLEHRVYLDDNGKKWFKCNGKGPWRSYADAIREKTGLQYD